MIAHVSIAARDPRRTALLLASLMGGETFAFPVVPGAWIAVARDGSGTAIEVYPESMAHHPGKGEVDPTVHAQGPQTMPWEDQIFPDESQVRPSAFHFAMSSPLTERQVLDVARADGLRAVRCDRAGVFALVEVWIDNVFMVEVLCGCEIDRYRSFMNPRTVAAMFGLGLRPDAKMS